MPQIGNIVLKDSADGSHTFAPSDITGGVATFAEATGTPIGDPRLTIGRTQTQAGRRKVTLKLSVPFLSTAVVNGVNRTAVARVAYANIEFSFDGSSTAGERATVRDYVRTLFERTQTMTDGTVVSLQGLF